MPKHYLIRVICCLIPYAPINNLSAQSVVDSSVYKQGIHNIVTQLDQGIGQGASFYNGYVYTYHDSFIQNNAYLNDAGSWENGTVNYDGQTFNNLPMMYDLFTDELVIQPQMSAYPIRLVKDKVMSFELLRRKFINIGSDAYGIKSGYYEHLYDGKSTVINKLEKIIKASNSGNGTYKYFTPVNDYQQYYIKKGDKYYPVSSEASVLDLFKDRKKELKQFIKTNGLDFNKLREVALTAIATYYDKLTE